MQFPSAPEILKKVDKTKENINRKCKIWIYWVGKCYIGRIEFYIIPVQVHIKKQNCNSLRPPKMQIMPSRSGTSSYHATSTYSSNSTPVTIHKYTEVKLSPSQHHWPHQLVQVNLSFKACTLLFSTSLFSFWRCKSRVDRVLKYLAN